MNQVVICARMKWTWQEFSDQPLWYVNMLAGMFKAQADHEERQSRRNKP